MYIKLLYLKKNSSVSYLLLIFDLYYNMCHINYVLLDCFIYKHIDEHLPVIDVLNCETTCLLMVLHKIIIMIYLYRFT